MLRLLCFLLLLSTLCAAQSSADYHQRWIVKLSDQDFSKVQEVTIESNFEVSILSKSFNLIGVMSEKSLSAREVETRLSPFDILNIYPDRKLEYRDRIPDDFDYSRQWNMDMISVPGVWEHAIGGSTAGGEEIVIAILDVGYDIDHLDLQNNFWFNPNEIPLDDRDNDDNGYKDDYYGVNIDTQNDSHNIDDHGTKVAGVIGAEGNNGAGVAGVNWKVKMLPIGGVDHIGEIIVAMEYVIMMKQLYLDSNGSQGANIIATNLSAGVARTFPQDSPDWCPFYDLAGNLGILSVSAAPNEQYDVDKEGDLPSLCDSEFLITVTNTDGSDFKVVEAGYGKENIDLGAPGERVYTTNLNDDYGLISGTSGSAPHVAGLIGLLYSLDCTKFSDLIKSEPVEAAFLVKSAILEGVDVLSSLNETVTKGRVNAYNAFLNIVNWCTGNTISDLDLSNFTFESQKVSLRYTTKDFSEHKITIYNVLGHRLKEVSFTPSVFNEKLLEIDVEDLDLVSGNYIFNLSNETERVSKMFSLLVQN